MSTTDEEVKVPALAIRSAQDIIGQRTAGKAIEEIFNVFHPAPPRTELAEIFTPETAQQFLERVAKKLVPYFAKYPRSEITSME